MYGILVRTMHSTVEHGFFLRLQSCDDLYSLFFFFFNFRTPESSGMGILNGCYPALRGFDLYLVRGVGSRFLFLWVFFYLA